MLCVPMRDGRIWLDVSGFRDELCIAYWWFLALSGTLNESSLKDWLGMDLPDVCVVTPVLGNSLAPSHQIQPLVPSAKSD